MIVSEEVHFVHFMSIVGALKGFAGRFVGVNGGPDHLPRLQNIAFGMVSDGKNLLGFIDNDFGFKCRAIGTVGDQVGKKSLESLDVQSGFM